MDRLSIVLNGTDFSAAFHKYAAQFSVVRVEGAASGVAKSGVAIVDLVHTRDRWILPGNAVPEATFRALSAVCRNAYVTAAYIRPDTGKSVTVSMIPELTEARRISAHDKVWYDSWMLTLEER